MDAEHRDGWKRGAPNNLTTSPKQEANWPQNKQDTSPNKCILFCKSLPTMPSVSQFTSIRDSMKQASATAGYSRGPALRELSSNPDSTTNSLYVLDYDSGLSGSLQTNTERL